MDSSSLKPSPPSKPPASPPQNEPSFARLISTCVSIRLFIDTGVQFFNPFLPIVAAGMRVDPLTLGRLVALRSFVGLIAPFIGSLADRYGFRLIMRISLLIGALGTAILGMSNQISTAALGMIIWGIGLAGFAPTMQAYISSRLPYNKRARGIGILEYSWALAGIIGLFAIGYLIEYVDSLGYPGWRAPFFVFSISMLIASIVISRFPPEQTTEQEILAEKTEKEWQEEKKPSQPAANTSPRFSLSTVQSFFDLGPNSWSAYATIFGTTCLYFAAMQLLITHGLWLQTEYGLKAAQLGTIAFILGFSDLAGSGLVSLITDRIGKKRSVLLGIIGTLLGFILMPFLNTSVVMALVGILVGRGFFEFAIVSSIPLLSEQVPTQRGKVMTMGAAVNLMAATIASVTGPWLYTWRGVQGFTVVSAVLTAVAIYIIWFHVQEDSVSQNEGML